MRFSLVYLVGTLAALLGTDPTFGQTNVYWIGGPGPETWNSNSNWQVEAGGNFIPQATGGFNDHALIGNGETALLANAANFPVGQLWLGSQSLDGSEVYNSGALNITNGGSLEVIANGVTSGSVLIGRVPGGNAPLGTTEGQSQQGVLSISGNGSLSVDNRLFLERRNNAKPLLTLAGTAAVVVGGDSDLRGTLRTTGPAITFTTDSMQWGGQLRYIPEITQVGGGASHSAIQVAGTATLNSGSTIAPEFASSPIGGEVYTLVSADSIVNNGVVIDDTRVTLAAGRKLNVSVDRSGATELLQLSVDRVLTLTVDRQSGEATIGNANSTGISIKGYSIRSPSGSLNPSDSAWMSFDDLNVSGGTWHEANPTASALTELNLTDSRLFSSPAQAALGPIYTTDNSQFGIITPDDLSFSYQTTSGETKFGIVEYTGGINSLVLRVDPDTGNARVSNDSQFSVEINGYSISSGNGTTGFGSLMTTWDSLDDQNVGSWHEANPDSEGLSELNLTGGLLLNPGDSFDLDGLWDPDGNRDLNFTFSVKGSSGAGDFNDDGRVNLADYTVWRDNLGGDAAALNGNGSGGATVGDADYNLWKSNFGNFSLSGGVQGVVSYENLASAATQAGVAVPEPSSLLVLLAASASLFSYSRFSGQAA